MLNLAMLSRRAFLPLVAAVASRAGAAPVKIGHREASMKLVGDLRLFETASRIPGLNGVELQVVSGAHDLWSKETLRRYKREANRWGVPIPSLSGPFGRGVQLMSAGAADSIRKAIAAAEFLGASVILIPSFRENCPDPDKPEQMEPVVSMLRTLGPVAADAGVVLGLENSLNPARNASLIDHIGHANVRMYFDLDNGEFYGHHDQVIPGISLLGRDRICQVHVKNEDKLIEEAGRIDWRAAFRQLQAIGYDGWYVLESRHSTPEQIVEATTRNIRFIRRQLG